MSNPSEGAHTERVIDGRTFDVWPLYWPEGGVSWEVRDVASDSLLTSDESLDDEPSDDELRDLAGDTLLCKTCGDNVWDVMNLLREHLASHHGAAWDFEVTQVRDCFKVA